MRGALPWIRRLTATCDRWSIQVSHFFSVPIPLSVSISSALYSLPPFPALPLSLGAEFWEHFSMWNAEHQSRGVTPLHCFSRWKEEPRAMRPNPVHSKKTATFSHWLPSSLDSSKQSHSRRARGVWTRNQPHREQKGSGPFSIGLCRLFMSHWKQTKGQHYSCPPSTAANWHPHNKEWTGIISLWNN